MMIDDRKAVMLDEMVERLFVEWQVGINRRALAKYFRAAGYDPD
ncbi:hypothetical protein [Rhizobium sp. YTU87027]